MFESGGLAADPLHNLVFWMNIKLFSLPVRMNEFFVSARTTTEQKDVA